MDFRLRGSGLRRPASLLGGGFVGLIIAAYPYSPLWRPGELAHVRAYLLEIIFDLLSRVVSVSTLRFLHSPAGILSVFIILGMALGLLIAFLPKKSLSLFRLFIFSISGATALFALIFLVAWEKTLLFYPSSTVFSCGGAAALALASLASALMGIIVFLALRQNATISLVVLALVTVASASSFFFPGSASRSGRTDPPRQVIVIGIDAADWGVITPLARQGKLPNIQNLLNEGTYGDLRATLKIESPVIWTSIATGVRKDKHGIRGFVVRRKDTGEIVPISVSYRRVNALWDIASRQGKTTDVVSWYGSWPAEEIRGCYVSIRIGFRGLGMRVYPPSRLEEIEGLAGPDNMPDTAAIARIGAHLLRQDVPDLAMMYFWQLDPVEHRLWKYHAARSGSPLAPLILGGLPPQSAEVRGDPIEEEYIRMDEAVGGLLKEAESRAAVFIVSDHGMGLARGPVSFNLPVLLEKMGWLSLRPGSREVDWSRTLVFDSTQDLGPRFLSRDLMINVREESPVRRNPELYRIKEFLPKVRDTLADLKTVSGSRVFGKIRISGDPASGPVKIVVWPNLRLNRQDEIAIGADRLRVDRIIDFDRLSGMHRLEGIFLAKGPGIRRGYRVKDASILDITPTVLYFLGLPQARDMEGRLLTGIVEPAYLARNPVRWIPTYESGRRRSIQIQQKSAADEKALEMLRTLGYIR